MVETESPTEKTFIVLRHMESTCNGRHENFQPSYGYGVRHLQAFMIFLSLCTIYMARAHINATIVAMTDVPKEALVVPINFTANNNAEEEKASKESFNFTRAKILNKEFFNDRELILCNEDEFNSTDDNVTNNKRNIWDVYRVYAWPKRVQEMVLGSFFLGYMIMMSPMGLVCQRWGGKLPLQIGLFSSAFITFFTPWLAAIGDYKAVCVARLALGLAQAGAYPSIHTLIAKWVPVSERGRLGTYVYTGSLLGSILCYHVSGFLAVSRFGWPSIFWVIGILCLLMGLLMTWVGAPSPQQHRYISEKEKNFILGGVKYQTEKRPSTPWKAIMTSKPAWACFCAHIGTSTTFYFMFSQIPTYLHHAVGLNIKNSGLMSSLPYLSNFIMSICMGMLSDYCVNKNIISMKNVRIVSNSIASIGSGIGMYALSYTSSPALAVTCLIFCMAAQAGTHTGWMVNYIDLAPNFSGTLMATGNTLMNVSTLLLPVLISNTVTDMSNVYQWRIVLFVVGTVAILSNVIYIIFMSSDVQPWNDSEYQQTEHEDPDCIEEQIVEETKS